MNNKSLVSNENNDAKLDLRQNFVTPMVDIYEQESGLTLVADMPGVTNKNLKVDIDKGILTLEADVEIELKGGQLHSEFVTSGYYRQFRLPEHLDANKVDAQLKDGVLTLALPKAEAAKPKRIEVKMIH
jgi:HSP20 family molecular chaperone IbpA